jgi:hypothetical protein
MIEMTLLEASTFLTYAVYTCGPQVHATTIHWNDSTLSQFNAGFLSSVSYTMSINPEHPLLGKLITTNSPVNRMAKRKYWGNVTGRGT